MQDSTTQPAGEGATATTLPQYRTIVVGTDGSATAQEAVRHAVSISRAHGATLHLVTAASSKPSRAVEREARSAPEDVQYMINPAEDVEAMLEEVANDVRQFGIAVQCHAELDTAPAAALLAVAAREKADLIVVGNRGMHGVGRVLGSVPNSVAHNADCSVAIIRTT
jgi:nucleotide-binding universal stress UspA family protein